MCQKWSGLTYRIPLLLNCSSVSAKLPFRLSSGTYNQRCAALYTREKWQSLAFDLLREAWLGSVPSSITLTEGFHCVRSEVEDQG